MGSALILNVSKVTIKGKKPEKDLLKLALETMKKMDNSGVG